MDIQVIIEMLIDGDSYRTIAKHLGVPLSTLHSYTSKDEHSARVREALEISADSFADKAEQILIDCDGTKEELMRARELAQHYRWKAAKRRPRTYSDKMDITSDGDKLNSQVHIYLPDNGR